MTTNVNVMLSVDPTMHDPQTVARWTKRFVLSMQEVMEDETPPRPQPDPEVVKQAALEIMFNRLTKRGKGKLNATLIREVMTDMTNLGIALTPAPGNPLDTKTQPYVRAHRARDGRQDTFGYFGASYFAFTGGLEIAEADVDSDKLVRDKTVTWVPLDAPGARDMILRVAEAWR